MDVEALADPDLARARHEPGLGGAEILHGGHLDVGRIAFKHVSRRSRPFGDRDVVGEAGDAGGGGAPVRREDQRKGERLRRLHRFQRRARRGRQHPAVGVHLLDGIAHRRPRRGRSVALGRLNRARDEIGRGEGPGRVVDEHNVRRGCNERFEPCENALLACFAAGRGRSERRRGGRRQIRQRFVIERAVAGVDGDRHGRERPARGQRLERVGDQRAPGAVQILLRPVGAEPQAPAGGDDEKRDLNRRQLRAPARGRDAFPAHLNRRQRGRAGTQS